MVKKTSEMDVWRSVNEGADTLLLLTSNMKLDR
jgi:hypothetical protein